jgi:peroxiredoxin
MVSLTTPPGQPGWPAAPFDLPGTDGKRHSLQSVRGPNGTVVMFICNHCPYVKAVADKIVRDMTELARHGVGSIAVTSNDPTDYRGFLRAHAGVRGEARLPFPYVYDETQEVARARRCVHARLFRLRPGPEARLPRTAGRFGPFSEPTAARELFDAMLSSRGPARLRRCSTFRRLLDQVAPRVTWQVLLVNGFAHLRR